MASSSPDRRPHTTTGHATRAAQPFDGDISPQSGLGRLVAAVLMVIGIGAIGLLTATLATYFIEDRRVGQHPHIEFVRLQLERWEALTPQERRNVAEFLLRLSQDGAP
ncbi:MAG: potassium channel family protein [Actinobacteria bacterium]|nr:potassium channel family protein [Actinomycetota bacterium]